MLRCPLLTLTGSGDKRRNCSDHRLIVTSLIGGQDTDVVEASTLCQSSDFTRRDGSVLSNKMPGVPAIRQLHRDEQMHDIATIVLPVPNLVYEPAKLAVEI